VYSYIIYCLVLLADHWPSGTYGIPKPESGCPTPASQWSSGSQITVYYVLISHVMIEVGCC